MFKEKQSREIWGILLLLSGVIFLLSVATFNPVDQRALTLNRPVNNLIGPAGALISHLFRSAFGITSYLFPFMFFLSGWSWIKNGSVYPVADKLLALFFLSITFAAFSATGASDVYYNNGGFIGFYIYGILKSLLGVVGAYIIIIILNIVGLILLGTFSLTALLEMKRGDSDFSGKMEKFFRFISVKKFDDQVPLNSIDLHYHNGKGKLPWVVKKKILVSSPDSINGSEDDLKYLALNVPAAVNEDIFRTPSSADDLYKPEAFNDLSDEDLFAQDPFDDDFDDSPGFLADDVIETGTPHDQDKPEPEESDLKKNRIFGINTAEDDEPSGLHSKTADTVSLKEKVVEQKKPVIKPEEEIFSAPDEDAVFKELKINQEYIIPTAFLHNSVPVDSETWEGEIKRNSQLLIRTLADFGIEARVINVNRGPVLTLYEMQIAAGIKINRVVGLSDDIAMALAAYRVRIVAPIPGKSAIGIEIPNKKREMVTLGDIIKSKSYGEQKGSLKVGLGKDLLGIPVTLDLKKQPHLLIAGSTGSGKSVCVNSIITSIIYNYDPNYVRFVLVDPKMVELQLYDGMPHLLTPVITEPHLAPGVLKWSIFEMDRRYRLLASMNTRDIITYNEKMERGNVNGEKLPFIIIIIDELADLMMVASKEIEGYITRIAQKARAVGIHLVLATQRPSVDVITGIIKANFPARIAFQVAQKTDSRTIIDQNGAEKLLGKGDMLYQSPLSSYPVRIQGAFISEDEIVDVVRHLRTLGKPEYIDIDEFLFTDEEGELSEDEDELFVEALKIVEETRKASASYLQRRLSVGYNRAARMIERMEEMGYIGPQQGSKPRDVFI